MAAVGAFSERHPIRVFLVDGHEAVRQGLGDLLDAEPDMITVGTADSVEQSLVRVPVTHPDVAVVNVRLTEDIVSCRALRSAEPALSLLTLASFDDDTAHLHAVLVGASGSVLRQIRGPGSPSPYAPPPLLPLDAGPDGHRATAGGPGP